MNKYVRYNTANNASHFGGVTVTQLIVNVYPTINSHVCAIVILWTAASCSQATILVCHGLSVPA